MTTLHFVFLLLISHKGFEAEGQRLIPKKAISYEHNLSNCVENPENFRASVIPMRLSNQLSYACSHRWQCWPFVGSNRQFLPPVASDHSSVGSNFQNWPFEPTKGRFPPSVDS